MKTETLTKLAQKDAERWAAAEMFYGDGAGTRRKLLSAELDTKYNMPGYYEAFYEAYQKLDMNKFAENAIKERMKLDRAAKTGQNLRALKRGNLRGLSNGVFILATGYYVFYQTEAGVQVRLRTEIEARKYYRKAKAEIKFRKARAQGRNVEKID